LLKTRTASGLTFWGFLLIIRAFRNCMGSQREPLGPSNTYKKLQKKMAEHGSQEVEEMILTPTGQKVVKASRVLIVLDSLYNKFIMDGSLKAGEMYLDRMLGKPKESLNVTNGSDILGKLSDDELIEKISGILKAHRKGGARKSD
jgi:hypothetical protein